MAPCAIRTTFAYPSRRLIGASRAFGRRVALSNVRFRGANGRHMLVCLAQRQVGAHSTGKIVPDYAPGGQAFLFVQMFYSPTDGEFDEQIVCFVRPNGGL